MYDLAENDDFDREMIATYEEVAKLFPRPGIYRPIVLSEFWFNFETFRWEI